MLHVVKLGGSLLATPDILRRWLRPLAAAGGRLVVVPGGGPFADAVRTAQRSMGFDDRTAHRMALLAMEQYGLLLASLEPRLVPAETIGAVRAALRRKYVAIWFPARLAGDADGIEENWDVTSDSLAAWLALQLGASALWLVKSCAVPVQDPARLAAAAVVDAKFPRFCAALRCPVEVLGPDDVERLTAALAQRDVTPAPAVAS
jgi:dihydroneopterin aldolase